MKRHGFGLIPLIALVLVSLLSGAAFAAAPPKLWQQPEDGPGIGSGAGEVGEVGIGLAVSPVTGNVYVGDAANARVVEFTAWGEFVRAFGWGVDATNPEAKLQVCTATTGCKAGIPGPGAGQIDGLRSLAVDGGGNVYVLEAINHRVQKFDAEGNFVLMFGGEVNKATNANLCTAASSDPCGIGTAGPANGQFSSLENNLRLQLLAVDPGDLIYVGDRDRIQIFDTEGEYQGQLALPQQGEAPGAPAEGKGDSQALAFDPAGNLYFDFANPRNPGEAPPTYSHVYKRTVGGWAAFTKIEIAGNDRAGYPFQLATGEDGKVYVSNVPFAGNGNYQADRVNVYSPDGTQLVPTKADEETPEFELEQFDGRPAFPHFGFRSGTDAKPPIRGLAVGGEACAIPGSGIYINTSFSDNLLSAYGGTPDPTLCPPPVRPPAIVDQYASSVELTNTVLKAKINSRFWPTTRFYVEYGKTPCGGGGCTKHPAPPGQPLGSTSNLAVTTPGVFVSGLDPETTYHYRFVAVTDFEPGQAEVRGVGGEVGVDGAEGTFTTPGPALPLKRDCGNQAFRVGLSAALTDCRAYEMVSPVEKDGGDIVSLVNVTGYPARLSQSSVTGDRMTYSAYRPFGEAEAARTTSQYLATRSDGTGWSTDPISPPSGRSLLAAGANIDREYKIFSPDLCQAWLRLETVAEPVLDPAAVPGFANLYRRQNCGAGAGGYEALSTLAPPHQPAPSYRTLEVQGTSADGATAIFVANDNLPGTEAPEAFTGPAHAAQLYIRSGGVTRFVCVLPNGTPSTQACFAGNGSNTGGQGRKNQLTGAISEDGQQVFFSTGGALYRRINATQPQSAMSAGQCSEEEMACTLAIPGATASTFWTAAADGSRMIYATAGGALREFEIESGSTTQIANSGTLGMLGASRDATRIYFVSKTVLSGPNAAGDSPEAGASNLYYRELGEATKFVATLDDDDDEHVGDGGAPFAAGLEPINRASRVTADGLSAAFISRAPLTGYDNRDVSTGEPDIEVFLYDATGAAGEGKLFCVSCDPSGARPIGRIKSDAPWDGVAVAGWIPTWESGLYPSNVLSADGSRLFFNSVGPLVARDNNGRGDVYEWRRAASKAACIQQGAERYAPAAGGCLSLISSGESSLDSEFLDANPSGRDVFFTTSSSLLAQDPGLIDVYDAREGGGLPPPPSPPAACEGEACQSPLEAPNDATPASAAAGGAGNVRSNVTKPRCKKGKVRRKGRCVTKKKKKRGHHRAANNSRRASR